MLQSKITNRSTLATKWIQSHSNSHTQSQPISEITVPDEILMKRRILRSFFGYFVLLNILVNTVRTLNTDNTTKMPAYVSRLYTHTRIQANNTHTHTYIDLERTSSDEFLLCTHLLVSQCLLFVCVCLFEYLCALLCTVYAEMLAHLQTWRLLAK